MERLCYTRLSTSPVGRLILGASSKGLAAVEFDQGQVTPNTFGTPYFPEAEVIEDAAPLKECIVQLEEYFAGTRREFTMPLDLRGPEFHKLCWQALCEIPYGETRSYAQIAKRVGSPAAFRAVGQANHHNPVAIIVPCHRVITAGGQLGGYGGGLDVKERLLKLEGASYRGGVKAKSAALPFGN